MLFPIFFPVYFRWLRDDVGPLPPEFYSTTRPTIFFSSPIGRPRDIKSIRPFAEGRRAYGRESWLPPLPYPLPRRRRRRRRLLISPQLRPSASAPALLVAARGPPCEPAPSRDDALRPLSVLLTASPSLLSSGRNFLPCLAHASTAFSSFVFSRASIDYCSCGIGGLKFLRSRNDYGDAYLKRLCE